jgi:hypothetical protein
MQINDFLSLVKQMIGKELVMEVDSPENFSMGSSSTTSTDEVSDTSDTSTSTDTIDTNVSSLDNSTVDLGLDNSNIGGSGLTPTYDIDVDVNDEENPAQSAATASAPKYRILDVIFDEDDDLNTKVKIQNIVDGKVETKHLNDIII